MPRSKFYRDFTYDEIISGHIAMIVELEELKHNHAIRKLFLQAWDDFKKGKFSYDGATFVKERFRKTLFEVAAFIHDWRNSLGYVGQKIDQELFAVMITLRYQPDLIAWRWLLCRITPINVLRHKILGSYKKELPKDLFLIN